MLLSYYMGLEHGLCIVSLSHSLSVADPLGYDGGTKSPMWRFTTEQPATPWSTWSHEDNFSGLVM